MANMKNVSLIAGEIRKEQEERRSDIEAALSVVEDEFGELRQIMQLKHV